MKHWQEFEQRHGDRIVRENFICDAEPLGLILVSGTDARDFLQNQISSDVGLIDESRLQLSSYSTPKGRMVCIFRIVQVTNGYLLLTVKSMVQPLLERLYRFIVRSDVKLADASDYFARFALASNVPEVLQNELLPREPGAVLQTDSMIAMQIEALCDQRRFVVLCLNGTGAVELWRELASHLEVVAFKSWRLAEIRAGIPTIFPRTQEEFVLQMANLGVLGGVSFKKGCYPGQEIVARMQYLGKLKRRMFLAELDTDRLPQPGDELVVEGKQQADGSGMVVDAEFDAEGLCHCLYVAQIARAESASLQLLGQPETRIRNVDLPYPPPA
ncbi:MAG TPA: folate-binding protein [Gammaproteobacteria bacterium]|nr:folate-binding protein [Gammaproteobacteria bacterium]